MLIYIDTDTSQTYRADYLVKLLEQAQHQRMRLISDRAGMGKSTVLTHLSKQIKQNSPAKQVVRIDLNDHTDTLNPIQGKDMSEKKAIEFCIEGNAEVKSPLYFDRFQQFCEKSKKYEEK